MIKLTWIPDWKAYAVRRNNRVIGLVRFRHGLPFRQVTEFV